MEKQGRAERSYIEEFNFLRDILRYTEAPHTIEDIRRLTKWRYMRVKEYALTDLGKVPQVSSGTFDWDHDEETWEVVNG